MGAGAGGELAVQQRQEPLAHFGVAEEAADLPAVGASEQQVAEQP
jgi:hypothetical protein